MRDATNGVDEKNLILVCEGQIHTVEYMHKNKVYPNTAIFDCSKFKEIAPYLGSKDDILVVINGAIDFSLAMIYSLFRDLDYIESKVHNITILSNIDLGKINTPYYLYEGDLFYGKVCKVVKGKKIMPDEEVEEGKGLLKNLFSKKPKKIVEVKVETNPLEVNEVMKSFLKYSKPRNITIHGVTKKQMNTYINEFEEKIVDVDLFKQT